MTLEVQHTKEEYNLSQLVLYPALRFCWTTFAEHQPQFLLASGIYTAEYGEEKMTAVNAAEAMPDYEVRSNIHELLRQTLGHAADNGLVSFNFLKVHIYNSFPAEQREIMLQDAGSSHYRKAAKHDWESVSKLLGMAFAFIDENLTVLETGGMPVSFPDNFATTQINFETGYTQFIQSEKAVWKMREDKIIANNAIYQDTMAMLKVGQNIFRNDEAIRKMFVFSHIVKLIQIEQGGTPTTAKITMKTDMTEAGGSMNIGEKLTNGSTVKNIHGDNTSKEITGDGVNTVFYDKTYVLLKIYTFIITGKIQELLELHLNNSRLTYIKFHKSMKKLQQFIAQGNMFPTVVVDDVLIFFNKFGSIGTGKIINMLGSEPPSAAGLQAKAELESRGWTVLVAS